MNVCAIGLGFNPAACISDMWTGFAAHFAWLQYWPWALGVIVALLALWGLAKVKEVAGTPGVIGALGVAAYLIGYWRGHKGESVIPVPHENVPADSPDAAPSAQLRGNSEVLAKTVVRPAPRPPNDTPPPSLTSP
jgi:hypothetical protein